MISNNGHDENNKIGGGKAGDQTGGEWKVINWYQFGQKCILRHPDAKVRDLIAVQSTKAANNDHCGYDQWQRLTYDAELIAAGNDPAKIEKNVESDCSSGTCANVRSVGRILGNKKLANISNNLVTQNMRVAFKNAGFEVLTDPKFLSSDKYLLRGDIILNDSKHVCVNLTNGSESQNKSDKPSLLPIADVAKQVIDGKWGNGDDRKKKLEAAGYNYTAVQTEVNAILKAQKAATPAKPKTTPYVVTNVNTSLRIRSGAGTNYSIEGFLSNGARVDVYEIKGSWARIGDNKWVSTSYIKKV